MLKRQTNTKHFALVAEHPPAYNFRGGTANLIKTYTSYHSHPFAAVVAADQTGPNPLTGPWDSIPTLALFRPKSLFPKLKLGLGLLDNTAFRLQRNRVIRFMEEHGVQRQFVMVANNARFALLAANLPPSIPRDVYIVDDFVADSHIYKVSHRKAQKILDRLVNESDRVFAISPLYAEEIQKKYNKPCYFLPLPVPDSLIESAMVEYQSEFNSSESSEVNFSGSASRTIIIHHSGHIHHLYADALATLIHTMEKLATEHHFNVILELWGNVTEKSAGKALNINIPEYNQHSSLKINICGEVTPIELAKQQKRANFLLLVNSFLPEYENQVKCSFSSKICEYMVSGVPILLYAPPYSSLTVHLNKYNAAHIIDNQDSQLVYTQLQQILTSAPQKDIVKNARNLAANLHSSASFFKILTSFNNSENSII